AAVLDLGADAVAEVAGVDRGAILRARRDVVQRLPHRSPGLHRRGHGRGGEGRGEAPHLLGPIAHQRTSLQVKFTADWNVRGLVSVTQRIRPTMPGLIESVHVTRSSGRTPVTCHGTLTVGEAGVIVSPVTMIRPAASARGNRHGPAQTSVQTVTSCPVSRSNSVDSRSIRQASCMTPSWISRARIR